jgi:thioredoxin reductase
VSWRFVDAHAQRDDRHPRLLAQPPPIEKQAIARRFWEVGRLTLEYWLVPRLENWDGLHRWAGTEVVEVRVDADESLEVALSNGERLTVDHVVFASGYRCDLTRVPYLSTSPARIEQADGFPVLDESFATSVPGLYITGFSATQDFGPFFGFVKGCPAAATLIVRDLLSRA